MSGTPRSSSSSGRGWRAQSAAGPSTTSKRVPRVLLGLLGLALTGLLGCLLWWWFFQPKVHLVCLSVNEYNSLAARPIPFAREDIEQLKKCSFSGETLLLEEDTHYKSIETLSNKLQAVKMHSRDTLVFYLSAHGVSGPDHEQTAPQRAGEASHETTAYLLCGDYEPTTGGGRYKLGDLLAQIGECPAARKLLILDAGHLAADPSVGMAVNEFPRLLVEEVGKLDSDFWVLTANRPLQTSHVSYPARRSLFGYFVTEGLRGAADRVPEGGDGNGRVDLAELYNFVSAGVRDWVDRDLADPAAQSPLLLRGGEGEVTDPSPLVLVRVADAEPKADEVQAGAPEKETEDSPEAEASDASEKAADGKTDSGAPAPAAPNMPKSLEEAWKLRDDFVNKAPDRRGADSWSPIDYAPHLWRQFHESLLAGEQHSRCGDAFAPKELESSARTILATAETRFQGFRNLRSGQAAMEVAQINDAIQLKNDLVFYAPDYVRWHARPTGARFFPMISDLLEKLGDFIDALEDLEREATRSEDHPAISEALVELKKSERTLRALRQEIDNGLETEFRNVLKTDETVERQETRGKAGLIEDLLSTPLLSGEKRMELRTALAGLDRLPPETGGPGPGSKAEAASFARRQWDRLAKQAMLQKQLVRLADPTAAKKLRLPGPAPSLDDPQAEESLWSAYREFGKQLAAFYADLPTEVHRLAQGGPVEQRAAERLLRLVGARYAEEVDRIDNIDKIAIPTFQFRSWRASGLPVVQSSTSKLKLPRKGSGKRPALLKITVNATGLPTGRAQMKFDYDRNRVSLESVNARSDVDLNEWHPVVLQPDQTVRTYRAAALTDNTATASLDLAVRVRLGGKEYGPYKIELELPPPDEIDLVVHRIGGRTSALMGPEGRAHVMLHPFPNRENSFHFALKNRSGEEKRVTVQLLAVRAPGPDEELSQKTVLKDTDQLAPGVEKLTDEFVMVLPDVAEPRPIEFPAPPEEKSAETQPETAEPEKDEPAVPTPLLWACVIRDQETREPKWIKWIEFRPIPPKAYLEPKLRPFDATQKRITIRMQPRDTDGDERPNEEILPPLGPEDFIPIRWETAGTKKGADLTADENESEIFVKLGPEAEGRVSVGLNVDGWPRAFVFQVDCEPGGQVSLQRAAASIQITSPRLEHGYDNVVMHQPMPVAFRVDAPDGSFEDSREFVVVRIVGEHDDDTASPRSTVGPFYRDRQLKMYVRETSAGGIVRIRADVSDFEVNVSAGDLNNMRARVLAELVLYPEGVSANGGQRKTWQAVLPVVLDSMKPEFLSVDQPGRYRDRPNTLRSSFEAHDPSDGSGIAKVVVGIDVDGSGDLEGEERVELSPHPGPDGKWPVQLPMDKLTPGKQYALILQLTDRAGNPPAVKEITFTAPSRGNGTTQPLLMTVVGRITSKQGEPRPGIDVTLRPGTWSTKTAADGRFVLTRVPAGKYMLLAEGNVRGDKVSKSQEIVLPAGQDLVKLAPIILSMYQN